MLDHAALCAELSTLRRLANIWVGQDAEDLVQATAEKALRSAEQFKGGNLQSWLVTIMRSERISSVTHREMHNGVRSYVAAPKQVAIDNLPEDYNAQPPAQESAIALQQAIDKLGNNSWLVASAYGYSGDEIAAHYNTTRQRVQKHIYDERRTFLKTFE